MRQLGCMQGMPMITHLTLSCMQGMPMCTHLIHSKSTNCQSCSATMFNVDVMRADIVLIVQAVKILMALHLLMHWGRHPSELLQWLPTMQLLSSRKKLVSSRLYSWSGPCKRHKGEALLV